MVRENLSHRNKLLEYWTGWKPILPDMKADAQVIPLADELVIPWDLTEWFESTQLRQWILEAIETLNWSNPEVVEYLRAHPAYQPKILLCLLTYAYASGVYDSAEIVRRCERDAAFREICGKHAPTAAKSLSRFRRENRGLLKWSLVQLFKKAVKVRHGDPFLPAGLKSRLLDAAVIRLDLGRQMDRGSEGL